MEIARHTCQPASRCRIPDRAAVCASRVRVHVHRGTVLALRSAVPRRSEPFERALRYALVLLAVYLTYLTLSSFLAVLTWAVMFAILFHGMQAKLAARIGPNRAAVVTTLFTGIAILAPAVILAAALAHEMPQVSACLDQESQNAPDRLNRVWAAARARALVTLPEDPTEVLTGWARRAIAFLAPRASALAADVFATLGNLAAMLFALFFFVRDGDAMSRKLRDRLPFPEEDSDRLLGDTRDLVIASISASAVVAVAQGIVGGATFWFVGLGAPVFWGVTVALASLLPVVGAAVVWVPASIGLLLSGEIWRGVIMLLAGVFGITMVGNVLRPMLLGGKTSASGLVIFFGLLGGAFAFGFIGLVIGPIILITTANILEILRRPD